jgi:predicted membrane channel-forming protein YqfA (hemolysin III family)
MTIEIGIDLGTFIALIMGLMSTGILYNAFVSWAARRGYKEGFTSIFVAGGVMMVLIALSILSIQMAVVTMLLFVAAGTPMIVGSIVRYVTRREASQRALVDEVKNDKTQGLA